jgi:hypothetical protein
MILDIIRGRPYELRGVSKIDLGNYMAHFSRTFPYKIHRNSKKKKLRHKTKKIKKLFVKTPRNFQRKSFN